MIKGFKTVYCNILERFYFNITFIWFFFFLFLCVTGDICALICSVLLLFVCRLHTVSCVFWDHQHWSTIILIEDHVLACRRPCSHCTRRLITDFRHLWHDKAVIWCFGALNNIGVSLPEIEVRSLCFNIWLTLRSAGHCPFEWHFSPNQIGLF